MPSGFCKSPCRTACWENRNAGKVRGMPGREGVVHSGKGGGVLGSCHADLERKDGMEGHGTVLE